MNSDIPTDQDLWNAARAAVPNEPWCPPHLTLAAYLDDRLDDGTSDYVEAHLAGCARCLDLVIALRLDPPAPVEASGRVVAAARALVVPAREHGTYAQTPSPRMALAAAAALVAMTGLTAWLGYDTGRGIADQQRSMAAALSGALTFGLADHLAPDAVFEEEP